MLSFNTLPMEARLVDELPPGNGWQFEPKWDGFRCLAFRSGSRIDLKAKSGKSLARYFPEIVSALRAAPVSHFAVDGELTIAIGNSLSFDALQARLHPAQSRILKLAAETPATFILFDCLMADDRKSLLEQPLTVRRATLEELYRALHAPRRLRLSPFTRERRVAQRWLNKSGGALDGVMAKLVDGPYVSGERAMLKVKRLRTADCVVGGFRYATKSRLVGSLLELKALIGKPGFTGNAPGGPSRWSTERSADWQPLRPQLVVEVCYDHVSSERFRHGTRLLRWRPDKAPRQCTFEQIQPAARSSRLIADVIASPKSGK